MPSNSFRLSLVSLPLVCALALSGCEDAPSPPSYTAQTAQVRSPSQPAAIAFVQGYEAGRNLAQAQQLPMMVLFTFKQCRYCQQMKQQALSDPRVVDLSARFVCIEVDLHQEPDVCREFGVRSYPTIQFLSPAGVVMDRMVGKRSAEELATEMEAALLAVPRVARGPLGSPTR